MGMYTELVCAFELRGDTPKEIVETVQYMTGQTDKLGRIPYHNLFETTRWQYMLNSDSYYFSGDSRSTIRKDHLFEKDAHNSYYVTIRSNLKNYDNEIEKFIDWMKPYIVDEGFIGYKRYEEDEEPELIFV